MSMKGLNFAEIMSPKSCCKVSDIIAASVSCYLCGIVNGRIDLVLNLSR